VIRQILKVWLSRPWYPFVFAAYPSLALLSVNAGQVRSDAGARPLVASTVLAGILVLVLWLRTRQIEKAAFLATLWLVLFFSYGHAFVVATERLPEFDPAPILLTAWSILAALSVLWARARVPAAANLNIISAGLVIFSLTQFLPRSSGNPGRGVGAQYAPIQNDLFLPAEPPDIYYFILDSYARADLLKQSYDYDNGPFIQALEARGFYVARCSQANYVRTEISLGSSLNMHYLQYLDDDFRPESTGRRTLWDALKHNAVRYNLERIGYQTVAFATGYEWADLSDANRFLSPPPFSSGLTEFEALFIQTTLARHLADLGLLDPDAITAQNYRDRFNLVFDSLPEIARMPGPTFAYLHVISPHPPFVFDEVGHPTNPADFWNEKRLYPADLYEVGYENQTAFLNAKLLAAIDLLLSESKSPPVIILQGDHGPWLQPRDRRMWILNAYYLPGHADLPYPRISPVNTFRLVFNAYFGGNYDILDDVSYFSPVPHLYEFSEVPNRCGQ
jgi:hypothetical protein